MSDLISRQAVLDGIAEWIVSGYADSEADCSHISSLVTHLPSVENKGEWIPVSERLPEKNVKDYLACCEDGYVATIMYDNGSWLINGNNVIAWMPLPEPYKA